MVPNFPILLLGIENRPNSIYFVKLFLNVLSISYSKIQHFEQLQQHGISCRLNLGGPFTRVQLTLDYARPRLWTLDISGSEKADGYGSPDVDGRDSNVAEIQVDRYITLPVSSQ